jgi:hypothetical protein
MIGQNPKKSNVKKTTFFYFIWCDVQIYLYEKKYTQNIKTCKYTQEIIVNIYEICMIYWTLWFHMIGISLWAMWRVW